LIRVGEIPRGFFTRDLSLYKSTTHSPRKSPDLVQKSNTSRFYGNSSTRSHGFQTAEFLKPGTKLCTEVLIPDSRGHAVIYSFPLSPFLHVFIIGTVFFLCFPIIQPGISTTSLLSQSRAKTNNNYNGKYNYFFAFLNSFLRISRVSLFTGIAH